MNASGSNTCSSCEKKYTWVHCIPDKTADNTRDAIEYVENETYVKCINETDTTSIFTGYCPYCEQRDRFEYKKLQIPDVTP